LAAEPEAQAAVLAAMDSAEVRGVVDVTVDTTAPDQAGAVGKCIEKAKAAADALWVKLADTGRLMTQA